MIQAFAGGALGVLLGMRHAFEPDHLAAMSTLVAQERSPRRGAILGALWGVGHTAALVSVGVALALLGAELPATLADVFEFGVAIMLVALGSRAIVRAIREGREGPPHFHAHGRSAHEHGGAREHVHVGGRSLALRPFLVGVVHGLAGSGALTALVLAGLPSTASRLLTMALFGIGSVLGMTLISGLAGFPLARIRTSPRASRAVALASGALSAGLGLWWGQPFVLRWIG